MMSAAWAVGGLLVAGALAGALASAYWSGHAAGVAAEELRARQGADLIVQAADAAASAAAAQIARIQVRHTTIRQEAEREIQTRVEYRDCVHSPEQLQRLNAALENAAPAAGAPGASAVP